MNDKTDANGGRKCAFCRGGGGQHHARPWIDVMADPRLIFLKNGAARPGISATGHGQGMKPANLRGVSAVVRELFSR